MGNSITQNDNNPNGSPSEQYVIDKEYLRVGDRRENIIGMPFIVRSNVSGLELEEYLVRNPDSPIELDSCLYKLRSSSYSKSIAVVYYHKLIDEHSKLFCVRTEKMKGRLS